MKHFGLLSIVVIFLTLFSCSKNEEIKENKCYVNKIDLLDLDDDYRQEITFTYTDGKVTSFITKETEKGGTNIWTTTITYNSNNQITQISDDFQTWSITFDANGLPDKMIDDSNLQLDFTFNANKQLVRIDDSRNYYDLFEYPNSTTHNYNKSNFYVDNIEEDVDIYQYDNKKNIYSSLGWLPFLYEDFENGRGDNNLISISDVSPDPDALTFTYQYNDKGYPTSFTADNSFGLAYSVEITYDCK